MSLYKFEKQYHMNQLKQCDYYTPILEAQLLISTVHQRSKYIVVTTHPSASKVPNQTPLRRRSVEYNFFLVSRFLICSTRLHMGLSEEKT
jgi:hypothetical protein